MNKGKEKGRGYYAPAPEVMLGPLEQALPEQSRDERGAAGDPAPAGNALTIGPSGPRRAGIQAVVLDLFAHLRRPLPGQPMIEVLVHLLAPLLLGRVRPGTEATVAPRPVQGIAQMHRFFLVLLGEDRTVL